MRSLLISLLIFTIAATASHASEGPAAPQAPVPGMVTMVDLGAKKCIPCKMMAPIIEELEKEYRGRAAIIFIDVWVHHEQVQKFGVKAIPTQIFYDKEGREKFRHEGFLDKESIERILAKLGVE